MRLPDSALAVHSAVHGVRAQRKRRRGYSTWGQGLSDNSFDPVDTDKMLQRLEALRTHHRELDNLIQQLEADGGQDIRIMGLKRDKLRTKDHISWLASKLMPDIIA